MGLDISRAYLATLCEAEAGSLWGDRKIKWKLTRETIHSEGDRERQTETERERRQGETYFHELPWDCGA